MKKIILCICICLLVFGTISTSYAQPKNTTQNAESVTSINENQDKGLKDEVRALEKQIAANHTKIRALKNSMKSLNKELKIHLAQLQKNNKSLSQAQITDIKTAISIIKTNQQALKNINNDNLKSELSNLKAAKQNKDFETSKTIIDSILLLQDQRIIELTKINENIKGVLTLI